MKVRTGGHTIEIPDERMRKGIAEGREGKHCLPGGTCVGATLATEVLRVNPQQISSSAPSSLPGWPKPTDKWNYSFCQFLEMEKQAGRIKHYWYEPFSIWLVRPDKLTKEKGVRHKVDFMIWYPDGLERKLEMVEVKGNGYRNLRDGITRYKLAKQMLPCFDWRMVKRERGGWVDY